MAGFSIGEFAALVFSGSLEFEDALELIKVRARAMQQCCVKHASQMVTCVGKSSTKFRNACSLARDHCREQGVEDPCCHVTAHLAPNLVTIGGHPQAVDYLVTNRAELNIRKVMRIPVQGAFHTQLMHEAKVELRKAVRHFEVNRPLVKVYSNVTGARYRSAQEIREKLPVQVVKPVMWETIVSKVAGRPREAEMPAFYEVGPGRQLGSLLRMCNGRAHKNYTHADNIKTGVSF